VDSERLLARCPLCGRFVRDVIGLLNIERLVSVTGVCAVHGRVTLDEHDFGYDEFVADDFVAEGEGEEDEQ